MNEKGVCKLESTITYWEGVLYALKTMIEDIITTLMHGFWPWSRILRTNIDMYLDNGAVREEHVVHEPFVGHLWLPNGFTSSYVILSWRVLHLCASLWFSYIHTNGWSITPVVLLGFKSGWPSSLPLIGTCSNQRCVCVHVCFWFPSLWRLIQCSHKS